VNRNSVAFTATITENLIKKVACRWISDGLITFTRGDRTGTLNFGDGDCDRLATLTANSGETFTIRLRR